MVDPDASASAAARRTPTHGAASPAARLALSLFVLWHLVSMGASLFKKTGPGAAVRTITGPYEKALGIWQSWGMFGPNPPMGTSWLAVDGVLGDGDTVTLPALVGEKDFERIDWFYSRVQKVERNMFSSSKKSLRRSYAAYLCTQWQGEEPLVSVVIRKERHMTPEPGTRDGPVTVKDIELGTYPCAELGPGGQRR